MATNLNSRQNSVCSGLNFSSESKLFGGGPPCPRTTSATLLLRPNSYPTHVDSGVCSTQEKLFILRADFIIKIMAIIINFWGLTWCFSSSSSSELEDGQEIQTNWQRDFCARERCLHEHRKHAQERDLSNCSDLCLLSSSYHHNYHHLTFEIKYLWSWLVGQKTLVWEKEEDASSSNYTPSLQPYRHHRHHRHHRQRNHHQFFTITFR